MYVIGEITMDKLDITTTTPSSSGKIMHVQLYIKYMHTLLSIFHSKCAIDLHVDKQTSFVKETVTNSDEGATCLREASIKKNAEDFKGSPASSRISFLCCIHKCLHHR